MVALPKPRVSVADPDAFLRELTVLVGKSGRIQFEPDQVPRYRHTDGAWRTIELAHVRSIVAEHATPVDADGREVELTAEALDLLRRCWTTPFRCIRITNQIPTPDSFFKALRALREFLDGLTWRPREGRITCGHAGRELSHKDFLDELCLCAVWHDGAGNIAPGADLVLGTFLAAAIFGGSREVVGVARRAGVEVVQ